MLRTLMVYLFVSCIGIGFSLDACGKDLAEKKEKQKSEAKDCGCSEKDGTDCFCAMFEYATYENGGNTVHCYFGWACYAPDYGGSACTESLIEVAPSMSASCEPGGNCPEPHCFTFDGGKKRRKPYASGQIQLDEKKKKIAEMGLSEMVEWEYDPLHPPCNSGIAVGDPVYARISLKKGKIYAKLFPITHVPTGRSVSLGFECHRRPSVKPQDVGGPKVWFDSGTDKTRMIEVEDERTGVSYCVFLHSQTGNPHHRNEQKNRTKKKE